MLYSTLETPIILLAFANDEANSLRHLEQEKASLHATFQKAEQEGRCKVIALYPCTPAKIIQVFLQNRGRVRAFHYAGHSDTDQLFLHKDYPEQLGVEAKSLAGFLATQPGLEFIFLNGCLNLTQAKAYHEAGVHAVIATNQPIGDKAAQAFAQLFYQSLVGRATVDEAFKVAESSFVIQHSDLWRGLAVGKKESNNSIPWQIFPEESRHWRLPLATLPLTRIPSIDFEKEFLGREQDLEQLTNMLDSSSRVVVVNGLGGIGKTVLATAFVQNQGGNYDRIAWINRGEDLINSFALNAELADGLNLPFQKDEDLEDRFRKILRALQQLEGRNLLVIDNAQEQAKSKEVQEQLPGHPNWQVLLTSRLELPGYDLLRLDTLNPDAAKTLFRTHFQGPHTEEALEELLAEIGYHTLTIELLARLLDKLNNVLSLSDLTTILRDKKLNDPELQEQVWSRHTKEERGIYLHLMKAFELSKLTDREQWLLKQFVVLPVERYSTTILADLLQEKPLALNKILNSLSAKGWLTRHEDKTFSIHRLIRQVVEYQLQPGYEDVKALVESLIQKMDVDEYTSRIIATVPWLEYAITVANFLSLEKQERIAWLQNNIANTYRDLGQFQEALRYHQKDLAILELVLNEQHPSLAGSYNNIALTYRVLGQFQEALQYLQKARVILELEPDEQDLSIASLYNNIANTYRDLGQFKEALRYHQKALAILESMLDGQHSSFADSYNNIALTYCDLGQFQEALLYHQKALAIRELVLDGQHPSLAQSYNNIALTYRDLGQFQEALQYHQKDLAILVSVLDRQHPSLADSYNNIANTYRDLGQFQEALRYHQKALAIRESVLDGQHPSIAQSYNNIALTYRDLGQFQEALRYLQKALVILESVLDGQHPSLANSYNNIILIYLDLGQFQEALRYHKKTLAIRESALDGQHPSLADSYNNITLTYLDLGQKNKAEEYEAKAASIRRKNDDDVV